MHEIFPKNEIDSKADIRNNLLVDKIAIQLKEDEILGNLSPIDIAGTTLQIMYRIGYYVDAINDVKLMKLSESEFSNYLIKLLNYK